MHGPPLVGWLLVVLTGTTGLYGAHRFLRRPSAAGSGAARRAAGSDALMGLGMALMAVPPTALDTRPWGPWLFACYFSAFGVAATVWAVRARAAGHRAHHAHHALGAAAMVYAALTMAVAAEGGGHAGHRGASGLPPLTGALLVYFAGYALWAGTRLVTARPETGDRPGSGGAAPGERLAAPAPAYPAACEVCRGISMLAMVLTM